MLSLTLGFKMYTAMADLTNIHDHIQLSSSRQHLSGTTNSAHCSHSNVGVSYNISTYYELWFETSNKFLEETPNSSSTNI